MVKLRVTLFYLSFFLVSTSFLLLYILGVLRYLGETEENTCDMTYMFEYPQYVRIKLDDAIEKRHPKYGLYAYGEGFVTDKLRKMQFTGIPVLFIPGNAGSHEQVRSLASISLRMSLKRHTPFHFDYFTVDLAEGYSAFHGRILVKQREFVGESIKRILSLYRGKMEKVVLIGHSMGGLVAKKALVFGNSTRKIEASILITLATPHIPQFALDMPMYSNYHYLHGKAEDLREMGTTVISIGGGARDLMVTTKQIIDPDAHLNVLATAVPHSWKSVDHLAILWCKQLLLAVVRALFDSVDAKDRNPHIYNSSVMRLRAFHYHLTSKFAGKYLEHYEDEITFDKAGKWIEITKPQFIFKSSRDEGSKEKRRDSWTFLMIPIFQEFTDVSIDTIDLETKDWLFLCSASSLSAAKICQSGVNISNRTKLFPTNKNNVRKGIDLDLKELRLNSEFTHIVVRIPNKSSESPIIHIDSYFKESRTMQIDGPSFSGFSRIISIILPSNKNIILKNDEGTLRHFVRLGIRDVVSFELRTVSPRKNENNDENFEHAVIELIEAEKPQNSTFISQIRLLSTKDIGRRNYFRIQTIAPATMKITVRPNYSYEIRISQGGITDRLAIFVRDRWARLYQVLMSFCLLLLSTRLDPGFHRTYETIIISLFLIFLLALDLEAIVAFGFLHAFALATCCTVIFFGSVVHNFAARFLSRVIGLFPVAWSNWLLREGLVLLLPLPYLPILVTITLVSTGCGALALIISVFLFLLKLIHMYEDYMEELLMASFRCITTRFDRFFEKMRKKKRTRDKGDADPRTNILNHLVVFITWTLAAIPAIPTVLVWAKTYNEDKYHSSGNKLFSEHRFMLFAWLLSSSLEALGLVKIPMNIRDYWLACVSVNFHRFLGWSLLITAGSKDPWRYQWTIPSAFAASVSYISFLSLYERLYEKSDDAEAERLDEKSDDVKNERLDEDGDSSNAKLKIN